MKDLRLILGIFVGNAVGALTCALAGVIASLADGSLGNKSLAEVAAEPFSGPLLYPNLLFVPFVIGLVAAFVWRPLNLSVGDTLLLSLSCTLVGLFLALFVSHEGNVCLIIAAPICFIGTAAGALVGRVWSRKKRDRLNLCLAPLIVVAIAAEPALRESRSGVVTDEIRIAAPPAKVWPHVLAFSEIPDAPDYWLFRVGLPYPTETTNDGNFVGADRACRFSGGAVFKEKVAEFVPERLLTFDIVEMPPDPELLGHLDAHRGQFELRDNGDGTTTLIGRTWYSLHVRPTAYFDWWTHNIFRAVHLRVMKHVKRLSESGA